MNTLFWTIYIYICFSKHLGSSLWYPTDLATTHCKKQKQSWKTRTRMTPILSTPLHTPPSSSLASTNHPTRAACCVLQQRWLSLRHRHWSLATAPMNWDFMHDFAPPQADPVISSRFIGGKRFLSSNWSPSWVAKNLGQLLRHQMPTPCFKHLGTTLALCNNLDLLNEPRKCKPCIPMRIGGSSVSATFISPDPQSRIPKMSRVLLVENNSLKTRL